MKAVAAFFFLGLVVVAFSVDNEYSENGCPAEDAENATHVPHPTNCSLFYTCNAGTPILSPCPEGLHFNAELQVCDWPAAANCIAEG